ncbi:MAG: ABC transporter ATP-binding protein [Chloroflexota bacterium]|nr:ABC transporter ATP-binding protein [Chloroflexota bacterium]
MSDPIAIGLAGVSKRYASTLAVDDVTLSVAHGEIFGFLGPNGAGKSTIVKMILGLTYPTAGQIEVLGQPAGSLAARAEVGYLPETFRFHDWLTASELLHFHARLARVDASLRADRVRELLELVGLKDRADDRLSTFSKGMMQRVGLAQSLVGAPRLVILDEPTSALDPIGRRDVRDRIRELGEQGVTVFLNSHLLSEVEQVCDRVAIIDHGAIVAEGKLDELLSAQEIEIRAGEGAEAAVREAVGESSVRSIDGRLRVRVADDGEIAMLVRRIVEAEVPLYDVRHVGDSLEDLFVRVAERGDV